MCAETACLVLRLEGPLQAWGTSSRYNRRMTDILPTRSAVIGMICAALGIARGTEADFLAEMSKVRMSAFAVSRLLGDRKLRMRRMLDFQIVQNTATADGGVKESHMTQREYLQDAAFLVFLEGERNLLSRIGEALKNPVWGLWLGRKACIPTAPVFAGIFPDAEMAMRERLPQETEIVASAHDVVSFSEGTDDIFDIPTCFESSRRSFAPRRVRKEWGGDASGI